MTAVPAYSGRHRPADTSPTDGRRLIPANDRVAATWSPLTADVRQANAPTHYATRALPAGPADRTAVMPAITTREVQR